MRISLFGNLIIALLINAAWGTAAVAKVSISDLVGIWVTEYSLEAFRETLSPSAAGGAQVVITRAEYQKGYKLAHTNFREGMRYKVLGFSPSKEVDVYKLRMTMDLGPDEPSSPWVYRVKVKIGARGVVTKIIFLDGVVDHTDFNRAFVRIPVLWSHYVNRLVFAGIWEDQSGQLFSFCESGEGHGPGGRSFTYKVPLSLLYGRDDPVWVKPVNIFERGADGYYSFERINDGLYIFSLPHPPRFENRPAIRLKKK